MSGCKTDLDAAVDLIARNLAKDVVQPTPSSMQAVEDFLAQALALEGALPTVRARVRAGIASFSGPVESRELALRLRELTRNFDGVRRVTGELTVAKTDESVPMDALPD